MSSTPFPWPTLTGAAQSLRNLFASVVGGDIAQSPHILTRTYARGLSIALTVLGIDPSIATGNDAVPFPGATVTIQVQAFLNGSWTTIAVQSIGPTGTNGQVQFSDTSTLYDLTQIYRLNIAATFPDGSSGSVLIPMWSGASESQNWGQGFSLAYLSGKLVGGIPADQGIAIGVSPTAGPSPLFLQISTTVFRPGPGQKIGIYYLLPNGEYEILAWAGGASTTFTVSSAFHAILTDSDGKTYQSATVAVTVT